MTGRKWTVGKQDADLSRLVQAWKQRALCQVLDHFRSFLCSSGCCRDAARRSATHLPSGVVQETLALVPSSFLLLLVRHLLLLAWHLLLLASCYY